MAIPPTHDIDVGVITKEEVYEHGVHGLTQGGHRLDPEREMVKENSMVEHRVVWLKRAAGLIGCLGFVRSSEGEVGGAALLVSTNLLSCESGTHLYPKTVWQKTASMQQTMPTTTPKWSKSGRERAIVPPMTESRFWKEMYMSRRIMRPMRMTPWSM